MKSSTGHHRRLLIRFVDLSLVTLALILSYWARTNWERLHEGGTLTWHIVHAGNASQFSAILVTLWIVVWLALDAMEAQENLRTLRPVDEAVVALRALTWSHVLLLAATAQYSRYTFSRSALLFLYPLSILFLCPWRVLLKVRLANLRRGGADGRKMLVVGAGETGQQVGREVELHAEYGIQLVGFVDDDAAKDGTRIAGVPVFVGTARAAELARELGAQDVLIAIPTIARSVLLDLIRRCEEHAFEVVVVPSLADLATARGPIHHLGELPVLPARGEPIQGFGRLAKRAFDLSVAGLGLIALAPLFGLLTLLIRLDSRGPALYRQLRVGRSGKPFTMYKFRSMVLEAEAQRAALEPMNESQDGVTFKLRADPRITRMGRWLRRFSLDELPQLINVVKGEMSLVGPRPPLVSEVELYGQWMRKRLEALPGLTGLWQVSGRSEIGFNKMVELDLFYIEHWSFALDLNILLRTIPAVLSGRGAY